MPFVNEYISEEDIKKWNLDDVIFRYNPTYKSKGIPFGHKFMWTIDRDQCVYLVCVRLGREERSSQSTWVLKAGDQEVEIEMDLADGGSTSYKEVPYIVIWDLVRISRVNSTSIGRKKVIDLLKEALTVYGDNGVNSYVDNVVVKFSF